MMKIQIVLCCVLALGACGTWKSKRNNIGGDFVDMAKGYGYPVESYDVQTEDGYILNLFRIPQGKTDNSAESNQESSPENNQGERRAVFLMHGLMTNSESFMYGGPSESLAMRLADAGYDVFLGNARGTIYGQRHTTLNPERDAAFWRFCWQEIGTKDLPALIDKAISVSGKSYVSYVGHNEGTTAFYVLVSENPSYSSKFDRHISLGPIAYMKNSDDAIIEDIKDHFGSKAWIMKNLGVTSFSATTELIQTAQSNCKSNNYEERMCNNVYFLFNGYNSKNLNQTTMNQVLPRVPSSVSAREVLHYAQLRKNGRFQKFSEDGEADDYDLSKVNVPVCIFYTPDDPMSAVEDVTYLANMLPNVYQKYNFEDLTNNLDLMWSKDNDNVFDRMRQALEVSLKSTSN